MCCLAWWKTAQVESEACTANPSRIPDGTLQDVKARLFLSTSSEEEHLNQVNQTPCPLQSSLFFSTAVGCLSPTTVTHRYQIIPIFSALSISCHLHVSIHSFTQAVFLLQLTRPSSSFQFHHAPLCQVTLCPASNALFKVTLVPYSLFLFMKGHCRFTNGTPICFAWACEAVKLLFNIPINLYSHLILIKVYIVHVTIHPWPLRLSMDFVQWISPEGQIIILHDKDEWKHLINVVIPLSTQHLGQKRKRKRKLSLFICTQTRCACAQMWEGMLGEYCNNHNSSKLQQNIFMTVMIDDLHWGIISVTLCVK